jgi:hypothetical protein
MSPLTASILGGIVCGIAMVVGGIFLLYKGAIELESASKDPALTVDLFRSSGATHPRRRIYALTPRSTVNNSCGLPTPFIA